jgi:hypothetical protein
MKNIVINNEKDLQKFLKLVAQESVEKSLRESDNRVSQYKQQKAQDSKIFKSLKEEEADLNPFADESEENKEDIDKQQPAADQEKSADKDVNDTAPGDIDVTPRKIISKINNIRAGHSLKNSEVKENLIDYLERLDDNELLVMFHYLDGVAKILNQTIKGSEAMDPSEDPINIDMTRAGEKKNIAVQPDTKQSSEPKKQKSQSEEDTTPPIKVNESQSKEAIRRKIRILMS